MSRLPLIALVASAAVVAAASRTSPVDFAAVETARIRAHLDSVEREFRAKDVSRLTPAQRAARLRNLDVLHDYWVRGVFPVNTDFPGQRVPYFVDRYGTRCAMAYLIEQSGDGDLVARVAAAHNNARIPALRADGDLGAWLWRNGITLDEAARIQPAYDYCCPGVYPLCPLLVDAASCSTVTAGASTGYKNTTWALVGADVLTVVLGSNRRTAAVGLLTGVLELGIGFPNFDDGDSRATLGFVNAAAGVASMAIGMYRIARADSRAEKAASRLSVGPWLDARGGRGLRARYRF